MKHDEAIAKISKHQLRINDAKNTPKKLQHAAWVTNDSIGEAGNYVEIRSHGGIFKYFESEQKAYMVTGPSNKVALPTSYLQVYTRISRR